MGSPMDAARGGAGAEPGLHKMARLPSRPRLFRARALSMVAGPHAANGLLLLLPLLQVSHRALGAGTAGRLCALDTSPPAHLLPTGGAGLRGRRLRPLGPVSGGGRDPGPTPPCGRLERGSVPGGIPPAPGAAVPAGARRRPAGAACGTWGKWRPPGKAGPAVLPGVQASRPPPAWLQPSCRHDLFPGSCERGL